jgi:hypothetical protein
MNARGVALEFMKLGSCRNLKSRRQASVDTSVLDSHHSRSILITDGFLSANTAKWVDNGCPSRHRSVHHSNVAERKVVATGSSW